ncbi:MAG: acyl-CoA dehydrogenase family protein [Desulfatiglandaceae bacterium]
MLNFNLSPAQEDLRRRVREFALREVLPIAWEYDRRSEVPLFVLKKAFDLGLMNGNIPAAYGGKGHGIVDSTLLTEEIAAACPGIATSLFDNSLGLEPLILCTNEPLKERYLPEIAAHFKLICFGTSEPLIGSDVSGIRCEARADGDDFILNGTKFWITNGGIADYFSVFATIDPQKPHQGLCAFLVEKDWEGVSTGLPIPKLGQRASNTAAVHFDNVRVPKENVVAPPGEGFVLAMRTFSRTRPTIGSFAVGAARSAMEYAIDYAKKRRAFGDRIANYQAIQFKIAEMYQKVETARLLTWKAAWEADQGLDPTISASISKFYATESAMQVVEEALQIFGGYGYTRLFPLEKLYRDSRVFKIYEGTSEIQRIIVAAYALESYQPVMPPLDELPMLIGEAAELTDEASGRKAWRCRVCGYIHTGDNPPEACPVCYFPRTAFKQAWPQPAETTPSGPAHQNG